MRTDMHSIKGFAGALLLASLAACGGGFSSGSGSSGGVKVTPTTVQMGSGTGGSFAAGVLDVGTTSLSPGGSTSITVNLQKGDGSAFTGTIDITFISPCFQAGLAQFTVSGNPTPNNVVTTTNGQATITYTATGCSGSDTITATAPNPDTSISTALSADGTVNVASATLGSIQWVSTSNSSQIALAGSGGVETATVVFKVTDTTGGPVANQSVTFKLETSTGGITFTPTSAVSGTDGLVSTIIHAGTEHGSARIKAITVRNGVSISTLSPGIVVSTGIPTQDKFSLALSVHNVEGYNHDGVTSDVTVAMADRFSNPVADDTTVTFTTNGGHIEPSCATAAGTCTVTWTSHNPRPSGVVDPSVPPSVLGHAEILAYTTGEEHFGDLNQDGVFDNSDSFNSLGSGDFDTFSWKVTPTVDNIGEIYMDGNENGRFDNLEYYFDFNKNSHRNGPNGKYHGAGCLGTHSVSCSPSTTLSIGLQDCIIMSTTAVEIEPDTLALTSGTYHMAIGQTETFNVFDLNGNAPPEGMSIEIVAAGPTVSVLQTEVPDITCAASPPGFSSTSTNPKGNGSYQITVSVSGTSAAGTFLIKATSPVTGTPSYSTLITVP